MSSWNDPEPDPSEGDGVSESLHGEGDWIVETIRRERETAAALQAAVEAALQRQPRTESGWMLGSVSEARRRT